MEGEALTPEKKRNATQRFRLNTTLTSERIQLAGCAKAAQQIVNNIAHWPTGVCFMPVRKVPSDLINLLAASSHLLVRCVATMPTAAQRIQSKLRISSLVHSVSIQHSLYHDRGRFAEGLARDFSPG